MGGQVDIAVGKVVGVDEVLEGVVVEGGCQAVVDEIRFLGGGLVARVEGRVVEGVQDFIEVWFEASNEVALGW